MKGFQPIYRHFCLLFLRMMSLFAAERIVSEIFLFLERSFKSFSFIWLKCESDIPQVFSDYLQGDYYGIILSHSLLSCYLTKHILSYIFDWAIISTSCSVIFGLSRTVKDTFLFESLIRMPLASLLPPLMPVEPSQEQPSSESAGIG